MDNKQEKTMSVKARLEAHNKSSETKTRILPKAKIRVTIPDVISHKKWMIAQRQAKGDLGLAQIAFIAQVVRFEGEQLTLSDIRELIDARDVLFMVNEIFSDEEEEEDLEKGQAVA